MSHADNNAFAELMRIRGMGEPAEGEVRIDGSDPFYATPFRVASTTAGSIAAAAVAANDLWELRTGRRQRIQLDLRAAAATVRTVDYTRARGPDGNYVTVPIPQAMNHMISVTQPWQARDGRWVLPHLNLPRLSERVLGVLQCESTPAAVAEAVSRWDAQALEDAIAQAGACGGMIRTPQEWLEHPQGQYLAGRPVVEITRVGDAPPQPMSGGNRPLDGVRVLDLTRILAGPVAGRTLAEHGAEVLMVTAPHLPQTPEHVRDTSHGKRSCFLDLRQAGEAERMRALLAQADVFIDGYRPGKLAELGFGADELLRLRPGLVHLSVSCFGSGGPFAGRPGWEQVAQAVTGVCHVQGKLVNGGRPGLVFAPMCDYTTGYLGAFGVMLALARRAREGGSYRVHVSLCQSAMLTQRQGLAENFAQAPQRLDAETLQAYSVDSDTVYGALRTLGPVVRMSETPPRWARPTPELGSDLPQWLDKGTNRRTAQ